MNLFFPSGLFAFGAGGLMGSGEVPDTEAPTVPGSLAASAIAATTLTLTWDASTDNVEVVSYEVEQALDGGGFSSLGTTAALTLDVTGLTEITAYRFRVLALDDAGNISAWGPSDAGLLVTTADETAPSVPANLAASDITETALTLDWDASADNVEVVSYRVEYCVDGDTMEWLATVAAPTTTLDVTELTAGTSYRFRVRALDAAGNVSAWGPDATGLLATTAAIFVAPKFNGDVTAVISDGSGGYYIGGAFTSVTDAGGTKTRLRLCHVNAAGIVSSFDPASDQSVSALALTGNYLVVAKTYNATLANNTLGGFDCRGFGVVDTTTGVALSWDPGHLANMRSLATDGVTLYTNSTTAAYYINAYDLASKGKLTFSHGSTAQVGHILLDGSTLYAALWANPATIGGAARTGFAALNKTTAVATGWDPQATTSAFGGNRFALSGANVVIVGDTLTAVNGGGHITKGVAVVDKTTAISTAFASAQAPGASGDTASQCAVSSGGVVAATGYSSPMRLYDQATGAVIGDIAYTGQVFATPALYTANKIILAGSIVPGGSEVVLSGTSRMFVISYP